jgi:hypothetical protein
MRPFPTERERAAYALGRQDQANEAKEPLTLEKVKEMTQEEVIARKAEVDAVMAGSKS